VTVPRTDVREVKVRRASRRVRNGVIGAAIGAGVGAGATAIALRGDFDGDGLAAAIAVIVAMIGAGVGLGIGLAIPGYGTVYKAEKWGISHASGLTFQSFGLCPRNSSKLCPPSGRTRAGLLAQITRTDW
jgi:hypothetical protein